MHKLRNIPSEVIAAVALFVVYVGVYTGRFYSPDGMIMFRQAEALVFDHSIHFRYPVWGLGPITDSSYGIGLSLLYAPLVAFVGLWAPHVPLVPAALSGGEADWAFYTQELYHDPIYRYIAPLHAVIAVLTVWLVARLVLACGFGRREALWAIALCGIASPWLIYSRGDFAQPLEGLCWVAALLCAVKPGKAYLAGLGVAVFYAMLTRPIEGSILAAGSLLLVLPRLPAVAVTIAAGIAGFAATLGIDYARFGWPLQSGYGPGVGWIASPVGLAGFLWSPARGLFWWFPALILAPVGVLVLWRVQRRLAVVSVFLSGALFVSSGLWSVWWGGLDWGPRLMLPAIPILSALAGIGMSRLPSAAGILAAIGGFITSAPGLVLDIFRGYGTLAGSAASSFDWQNYPLQQLMYWLQHRSGTDILGRPQLRGDFDNFWAHLPQFWPVLAAIMLAELLLLIALIRSRSAPQART